MRTIQIDYEAVSTKLTQMSNHVTRDVNQVTATEYRQISNGLTRIDGAVQSEMRQIMDLNNQKALACTSIMERLLSFTTNASRQMQVSEEQIARVFMNSRR